MNLFAMSETVKLNLQLDDGISTKYPRAFVYQNGTMETTIDLTHIAQGRYSGNWNPLLQLSIVWSMLFLSRGKI